MRLASLAVKNVLRNKFRTTLTIVGVATAIIAFVLLRTVISSWTAAVDYAAKDRIGTRHKVTFIMSLPTSLISSGVSCGTERLDHRIIEWLDRQENVDCA